MDGDDDIYNSGDNGDYAINSAGDSDEVDVKFEDPDDVDFGDDAEGEPVNPFVEDKEIENLFGDEPGDLGEDSLFDLDGNLKKQKMADKEKDKKVTGKAAASLSPKSQAQ